MNWSIKAMLPLPNDICSLEDPDAPLRWVQANAHRLTLSEEFGRFEWID